MSEALAITCLYIVMPILVLSQVLIVFRLVKGPTLLDRVVAVDLFVTTSMAIIGTFAILFGKGTFIDVIIVLAILMFLSTIGFAYYYEKKG